MKYQAYYQSPIGWLKILADEKNILEINFVNRKSQTKNNILVSNCVVQLKEYFAGQRQKFDLPIKLAGTPWQVKVWVALSQIPYGSVISYQDLAAWTGNLRASRAVGGAVNKNKLAIVIPCHRALGSRGQLVGYAAGLDKKASLLELENNVNLLK